MEITWSVRSSDIRAVRELIRSTRTSTFVRERVRRNVSGDGHRFSREAFWRVMIGCLITTQQRSGPDSAVARFLQSKPFPLSLAVCGHSSVQGAVQQRLTDFGGIRRAPTIAKEAAANHHWLEGGGWKSVAQHYDMLLNQRARAPRDKDKETERAAATFIDEHLKGFGPKQARNLWQWLGLTRYEIPLDSRVIRWLNENVFQLKLTPALLGDRAYYEFVLDGVQALCREAAILPCVFDGAVFSSFDREWTTSEVRNSG
jgi:hypothetical protein